jgi:hypothetical protein
VNLRLLPFALSLLTPLLLLAVPAHAEDAPASALRDYCPDRPGMNTPPCTIDPGRVSAEMSFLDWTRQNDPDARTDTLLAGDLALRLGVATHAELRLAWTPWGHVRTRDKATGQVTTQSGTGDVTLGIKRNLVSPSGDGFSLALLPSVTLPTGGAAIGAGDWAAGLQAPTSFPLAGPVSFAVTPEIDAAVDGDRHGRHLAYGSAAGFSITATKALAFAIEADVMRDEDPAGASTSAAAGIAADYKLGDNVQIDLAGEFGLNHATPGLRIYTGIARRF